MTAVIGGARLTLPRFGALQPRFFSPPVHFAWWAHMRRFLSVCPSVCLSGLDQKDWTIIHNLKSNIFCCLGLTFSKNRLMPRLLCKSQGGLTANVKLHFFFKQKVVSNCVQEIALEHFGDVKCAWPF